jgi:hypothetical protein
MPLTGPRTAPALGLRAGGNGALIVPQATLERRPIMFCSKWLRKRSSNRLANRSIQQRKRQACFRPWLEMLEDRALPSAVSFSPAVNYATGSNPVNVAVGDFNGDGKPDLAAANFDSNSVSVQLGNGDGTFQPARNYAVGPNARSVVVGDFDGDRKLDLLASGWLLLGNGDGTFKSATSINTLANIFNPVVGDFNGDGKLDLASAGSTYVSVVPGNGDGTFQPARNYAVGGFVSGTMAAGDFNGDGKLDLATGYFDSVSGGGVSVLLGNGDGTFQTARNLVLGSGVVPSSVAVGDFNRDGKLDMAVSDVFGRGVGVLLGNGDGSFQQPLNPDLGGPPVDRLGSVAVGDFNGDGRPDLAVKPYDGSIRVLRGIGDGTFLNAQDFSAGSSGGFVAVADLNGDGKPDLAVNAFDGVNVLLNQFVTTTMLSGPTSSTYGQPVALTASVVSNAGPVTAGTVTFLPGSTASSPPLPLNAAGQAAFNLATLPPGNYYLTASYSGAPGGAGTTGFSPSNGAVAVTVNPAPLTATAVNISPTAGAPFSGAVATFTNADPLGSAASYTATITWGDGSTSTGAITGIGTLTVSGPHTYADAGSYAVSVRISHNLGNTTTATVYPTATVTSLGSSVQRGLTGDIGFWHGGDGQALINNFNGGPGATALSTWLAQSFSNLYGNLWGWTNADVAAFYQSLFAQSGPKAEAQVLATALNVYATTLSLGGTAAQAYGFTVTDAGLGAYSYNAGSYGEAFGFTNNSTHTVYAFLKAVDYDPWSIFSNDSLLKEVNDLFDALNKAGRIR